MQAYLVISQGSRWTDVFRLQPGISVSIGRSSDNQIVIRDDRVSRHHAQISLKGGTWTVRDLGSRNGTQMNSLTIPDETPLAEGDVVQVAGCRMTFATNLSLALSGSVPPGALEAGQVSSAQTADLTQVPPTIVERRNQSRWSARSADKLDSRAAEEASFLVRLVFDLVSATSPSGAAQLALERLLERLQIQAGGVVWFEPPADASESSRTKAVRSGGNLSLLAAKQAAGQAYHRVSDFLLSTVQRERQAVLARNVQMDTQLSLARESGQRQTSSIICAPLLESGTVVGLLHAYTSLDERMLSDQDLELAVAVADTLALTLAQQREREQLTNSLDQSRKKIDQLQQELAIHSEMVGHSNAIKRVQQAIDRAAPTPATVLVRGESGVGKELVARAIHVRSPRREGPLVCLNCAALAPTLLESELFGHEKGSFTGATERKIGKFEAASGGTLLLDEIGEMSVDLQAKFLRVLEGQPFERLGGNKPIQVSVRVIAATNRDLEQAVRDKLFRSDLYFRLRVIEIDVPPLRERVDDIPILAEHFLNTLRAHAHRRLEGFAPEAMEVLCRHDWPGNVRELKNVIERAIVLGGSSTILAEDLSLAALGPRSIAPTGTHALASSALANCMQAFRLMSLDELEREHIFATLKALDGNKSRAAAVLGVERSTLDRKLKRYETDGKLS